MQKVTVDEVLDFAIAAEVSAERFYLDLAAKMQGEAMRTALEEFAAQERRHKAILEGVKQGERIAPGQAADLKIADYVVDVEPRPDMEYADALVLAMKREKAAFKLYTKLAESAQDQAIRETFLMLANEEAKHKLYFEVEYDQVVLKEN